MHWGQWQKELFNRTNEREREREKQQKTNKYVKKQKTKYNEQATD